MTLVFLMLYLMAGALTARLLDFAVFREPRVPMAGTTGVVGALIAGVLLFLLDINGDIPDIPHGLAGVMLVWIGTAVVGALLSRLLVVKACLYIREIK